MKNADDAFVLNNPISHADLLGRALWPIEPVAVALACKCKCKQATITFNGQASFNWGIYNRTLDMLDGMNNMSTLGSAIKVHWDVDGIPALCKYNQNESGTLTVTLDGNAVGTDNGVDNTVPQDYTDPLGFSAFSKQDVRLDLNIAIVFKCTSSDGTTVQKTATIVGYAEAQLPNGPISKNNVTTFKWQ